MLGVPGVSGLDVVTLETLRDAVARMEEQFKIFLDLEASDETSNVDKVS